MKYEVCFSSMKWFETEFRDFSSAKWLRMELRLFNVARSKFFLENGNPTVIALPKIPHTYIRQNSISALQTASAKLSLLHKLCYQQSRNLLLQSRSKYMRPDMWFLIKTLCQKAVIFYSKLQRRVAVHNQTFLQ
jgi:hypothetical protein